MTIITGKSGQKPIGAGSYCTIQRANGDFCDGPAWPDAPFPICRHHAVKLYIEMRGIHDGALMADVTATPPLDPNFSLSPEQIKRDIAARKAKRTEHSVVYYVRMGDVIKIGFTTDLKARMSQLRTDCSNVLATEPGSMDLEAKRHAQFAKIRIGRREDFTPTLALIKHIEAVREFHGDPVFRNPRGEIVAA